MWPMPGSGKSYVGPATRDLQVPVADFVRIKHVSAKTQSERDEFLKLRKRVQTLVGLPFSLGLKVRLLATAQRIDLRVGTAWPRTYELWDQQVAARAALQEFARRGFD